MCSKKSSNEERPLHVEQSLWCVKLNIHGFPLWGSKKKFWAYILPTIYVQTWFYMRRFIENSACGLKNAAVISSQNHKAVGAPVCAASMFVL
jgi:hypothetical protein